MGLPKGQPTESHYHHKARPFVRNQSGGHFQRGIPKADDQRKSIVEAILSGRLSKTEIALDNKVCRKTVTRLSRLYSDTGSVLPRPRKRVFAANGMSKVKGQHALFIKIFLIL